MTLTLVAGVRARGNLASTREDTDYMDGILLLERWKNPVTLLTKKLGHYQSDTVEVHHWEDQLVPYHSQINYGTGYADSATGLVVDDSSPFVIGDMVRIPRINETVLVTSIDYTNNWLGVVREYGWTSDDVWATTKAALVDDDFIERLGSGYEQGHPIPTMVTTQATDITNYVQDIRTSFGYSDIVRDTKQRGEDDAALQERKKAIEHAEKLDMLNVFNRPYAGDKGLYNATDGNTLPTACGGINHYLLGLNDSTKLVDQDDLTMFEFMDFLEAAYDKGSREKMLWCPPKLRSGLEKWGMLKWNSFTGQKVMGMPIMTWDGPHGITHFITHDMLKARASTLYNECFCLDMNLLDYVTISNGATRLKDAVVADGATLTKKEYQTIQCIRLRQPEAHARLRFKTVTAA